MEPSDEVKKFFALVAKEYSDDVAMENLHRGNMIRHLSACIIWIVATILSAWKVLDLSDPIFVTFYGVILIGILLVTIYNVHMKHKAQVKHLLYARQQALMWKDGKLP